MASTSRYVVRSSAYLFLAVAAATIITGVGSIVVARLLGPDDFAQYSMALVLPTLLFSATILGVDSALLRYVSKLAAEGNLEDCHRAVRAGVAVRVLTGMLFFLLGWSISDLFAGMILQRPQLAFYVRLGTLAVPFEAVFWVSHYLFQSLHRIEWSGTARLFQAVSKAALSIALIVAGYGIYGAVVGSVLSYGLVALASAVLLVKLIRPLSPRLGQSSKMMDWAKKLLVFGLPLQAVTLMAAIAVQYRIVVLAVYFSDTVVGNFNAAVNLATLLQGAFFPVMMVMLPVFSRISALGSNERLGEAFTTAHNLAALVMVPSAVLLLALSNPLVELLYGPEYTSAGMYLALLTGIFLLVILGNGVYDSFFTGVGENLITLKVWLAFVLCLLPVAPLLTIQFGVAGLVVSEIGSKTVSCAYAIHMGHVKFGVMIDVRRMLGISASCMFALAAIVVIGQIWSLTSLLGLLTSVIVFLLAFLTVVPLLSGISTDEISLLEQSLGTTALFKYVIRPILRYERALLRLSRGQSKPQKLERAPEANRKSGEPTVGDCPNDCGPARSTG